nr:glycerophosphodiester phosphodiesterase family protein [Cellulosimicrobium sp. MM]
MGGDGELPVTVAHRGYSSVAPENTLAAVAAGMRTGAEYVEVDVHTTADGVPVVLHDQTVDRTTDGTGDVAVLAGEQVTALDAGSWFSPAFAGQRLPSFAQLLDLLETGSSSTLLLEIKGPETSAEVERVVDMVVEAGLEDRVVLQSFDVDALRAAREHAPQIPRGLLRGALDADPVAVAQDLGAVMYNPSASALLARPGVVADLNAAGVAVMPYTVNSAADWARLTEIGVDGIITDRAGAFVGWKQAREQEAPAPGAPTVTIVSPAEGTEVERGGTLVVAASTTDADEVVVTVDGEPVDNGATVPAADLALGEHTVTATAAGRGRRGDRGADRRRDRDAGGPALAPRGARPPARPADEGARRRRGRAVGVGAQGRGEVRARHGHARASARGGRPPRRPLTGQPDGAPDIDRAAARSGPVRRPSPVGADRGRALTRRRGSVAAPRGRTRPAPSR